MFFPLPVNVVSQMQAACVHRHRMSSNLFCILVRCIEFQSYVRVSAWKNEYLAIVLDLMLS